MREIHQGRASGAAAQRAETGCMRGLLRLQRLRIVVNADVNGVINILKKIAPKPI